MIARLMRSWAFVVDEAVGRRSAPEKIFINCNALLFRYYARMSYELRKNLTILFHCIIDHVHCIRDGKKKIILNFHRSRTCLVIILLNVYNIRFNNVFKSRFLFVDYTQTLQMNIILSFLRVRLVWLYLL